MQAACQCKPELHYSASQAPAHHSSPLHPTTPSEAYSLHPTSFPSTCQPDQSPRPSTRTLSTTATETLDLHPSKPTPSPFSQPNSPSSHPCPRPATPPANQSSSPQQSQPLTEQRTTKEASELQSSTKDKQSETPST